MSWSAATLVTPPAQPAIAIADAKQFLRIDADVTEFDVQLAGFVAVAIEQIEKVCSIRLAPQTVEIRADSWCDLEKFPIGPVTAIDAVHYIDGAGAEQLLDNESYELFGVDLETGARPAFGASWPAGLRGVAGAIRVRLTVGYAEVPPPAWAAALYYASDLFAFRETAVVGTVAAKVPMSGTVESFLTNYRIWL